MRLEITGPTEGGPSSTTPSGYFSAEVYENDEMTMSLNLAPSEVPDLDGPEAAADFFEEIAEGLRALDGDTAEDELKAHVRTSHPTEDSFYLCKRTGTSFEDGQDGRCPRCGEHIEDVLAANGDIDQRDPGERPGPNGETGHLGETEAE